MKIIAGLMMSCSLVLSGCGTPSVDTGERDFDDGNDASQAEQPASLFEMNFGGGETEVTKNLPGDAVEKVGNAVKSIRGKSPPDIVGE
jgi:hypothetical protein